MNSHPPPPPLPKGPLKVWGLLLVKIKEYISQTDRQTEGNISSSISGFFRERERKRKIVLLVVNVMLVVYLFMFQGPLQNTAVHFWQMVWEQNTVGVVMLNKCVERSMVGRHVRETPD